MAARIFKRDFFSRLKIEGDVRVNVIDVDGYDDRQSRRMVRRRADRPIEKVTHTYPPATRKAKSPDNTAASNGVARVAKNDAVICMPPFFVQGFSMKMIFLIVAAEFAVALAVFSMQPRYTAHQAPSAVECATATCSVVPAALPVALFRSEFGFADLQRMKR